MRDRTRAIKEVGCIVAHLRGLPHIPCAEHHLTMGGKHGGLRLGHDQTVGLNDWSHQGYPLVGYGWDAAMCREKLGPSLAEEPDAFRAMWTDTGSAEDAQAAMLEFQNELLAAHRRATSIYPWDRG